MGALLKEGWRFSRNFEICEVPRNRGGWFFPGFIFRQGKLLVGQRRL
jgi:hypothetical protein